MCNRTTAWFAILALSAVALPKNGVGQQQEAASGGKPLSYWMARLDNRSDLTARAAIKEMGASALPDLIRMLRQPRPTSNDQGRALDAITCLGPVGKSALPDILPFATNRDGQLKIRAFFALKAIGPEAQSVASIMPTLLQALEDPEWTMRLAALNTLAALRPPPPEAVPGFVRLLNDSSENVRQGAMHSLVAQTNPIVIPVLDKQLHDKDSYVVTGAASDIGIFGAAAAGSAPRLRELLDDPLLTVRQAATNALAAITGRPVSEPASKEKADVSFNFPGMPLDQVLDIYENIAGKKVTMTATPKQSQIVRLATVRPLTKTEALQLLEEVLKEQAGLIIVHGKDGSLTAISKRPTGKN